MRYAFAILACSASKLDRRAPAHELYTGQLFRLSLQVANLTADRILILSAKHGVVGIDDVLDPYDESLPKEKHRRAHWGELVSRSLLREFGTKDRTDVNACREHGKSVLCLAPQSYVDAIGFMYGIDCWNRPLRHLGIGHQKAKLTGMLREELLR